MTSGWNSLRTKFTVGMIVVLLLGIGTSWVVLARVTQERAQAEVQQRGLTLLELMSAMRNYTSAHINPLFAEQLKQGEFVLEVVPAYTTHTVFTMLQASERNYSDFTYKEASSNPTDPANRADAFETSLLAAFNSDPGLKEVSGFQQVNGQSMFYNARPMRVKDASCLACHSTPDVAPRGQLAIFGTNSGFGWKVGQVIAAQVIYVPATEVLNSAQQALTVEMVVVIIVFVLLILVVNYLLRRTVLRPIELLAALATKISADKVRKEDVNAPALKQVSRRGDEFGNMALLFRKMAYNVARREAELRQELQELQIVIDETREKKAIEEVTNTAYFQELMSKAQEIRAQRGNQPQSDTPST